MADQAPVTKTTSAAPIVEQNPPAQSKDNAEIVKPPPDKLGSQFAALARKEKTLAQRETQLTAKETELQKSLGEVQELEKLSVDEILERIAKKKGIAPEDAIKSYIAKATDAKPADELIKESKDPAIQALYQQSQELKRANEELKAQLETRTKAEKEATERANVEAVQRECLTAATAAWSDESDYPLFFSDTAELSKAVLSFCANKVQIYEKTYGYPPDQDDIAELIKNAPKLVLDEILSTSRGKRIAALRAPVALTEDRSAKPRMSPNVALVSSRKPDETKTVVRTRVDHEEANRRAKEALRGRS